MVHTGHRLVDGLIQEYWGLFIKWDTAMYQVGTECFVPRSFHSHVSLKVGGIWCGFAIHHEFPPVSTECPQKFPWNSTSESETVASHSHINQAELRKFPWYDCPLYKARAIVDSAISSPIQLPVIQKMLPCPVFQLHLWSFFTAIWCHIKQKKYRIPRIQKLGSLFSNSHGSSNSRGVNSKRRLVDHWTQYQLCAGPGWPGGPIICISYILYV